jgi:hypothetical protein
VSLLEEVVEAHGGEARWRGVKEIRATARSGGFALTMKGQRGTLSDYVVRVSTERPFAAFRPFGGHVVGFFDAERVWIEGDTGELVEERRDPRAAFRWSPRRQLRWDDLDLLYFAGYAMWNYLTFPLLLLRDEVEMEELDGRRLRATFPPGFPTHSPKQVFHIDDEGLLRRHDYTAQVFGPWARARHVCWDHREFGGLTFPTRRRVQLGPLPRPRIIWIALDDVEPVSALDG